jgi:hypothetical protein
MRLMSIGTRAESQSRRRERDKSRGGFTLIEALVSLALLLAFASVVGPLTYQAHRILIRGDGEVQAELLLHSLLQTPFERGDPEPGAVREGQSNGMDWQIDVEPITDGVLLSENISTSNEPTIDVVKDLEKTNSEKKEAAKKKERQWGFFRVSGEVSWGTGRKVAAESVRLGAIGDRRLGQ